MPEKAPKRKRVNQPTALKKKKKKKKKKQGGQSDTGRDARRAKKKQKSGANQAFQSSDHSDATIGEDTRGKPTFVPFVIAHPLQSSPKISASHETTLNGDGKSTQEWKGGSTSLASEYKVRAQPVQDSERNDEDLTCLSRTMLLSKMIERESLKLKGLGCISDEDPEGGDNPSNQWLDTLRPRAKATRKASASSEGEQDDRMTLDTSNERTASQIWPQCESQCEICQATHAAIPGSTISNTCIRVSLVVQNAPVDTNGQSQHQSILIPTDEYELSVLGWLIWSTFVHQVALRNTTVGKSLAVKRSKDYVAIEICRLREKSFPMVFRTGFRSKSAFEGWWDGKRNSKGCGGKRWMVITFPWDMGEPDILDATFGRMGHLFRLPTLDQRQGCGEESAADQRAKSFVKNKSAHLCLTKGEGNRELHGKNEKLCGCNMVDKRALSAPDGKDDTYEVTEDVASGNREASRMDSTFDLSQEDVLSISSDSSQGDDKDFM